jgi:hypothetical protein
MTTGIGKSDQPSEHDSGIGRIRERTILLGDTLIAIDNIGSIQILDIKRNWWLARFGMVIGLVGLGSFAMPSNPYSSSGSPGGMLGMILLGLALVLIVVNAMQPRRKGLGIGTGDGRTAYVVSADIPFLERLLAFLAEKINTRNEDLTASFDIGHTTININGGAVAIGANANASADNNAITHSGSGGLVVGENGVASGAGGHAMGDSSTMSITDTTPPPAPEMAAPPPMPGHDAPRPNVPRPPPPPPLRQPAVDPDDALFADDPAPRPLPPPAPRPRVDLPVPPRVIGSARKRPHDPLLDGPAIGPDDDRDWLSAPGRVNYGAAHEGGGARWLLPVALLLLVTGGGAAGWYFYNQSQLTTSVSLIPAPQQDLPEISATPAAIAAPADTLAPAADPMTALPETPAAPSEPSAAAPEATAPVSLLPASPPPQGAEATDFTPPELLVARASGLRYRSRPSAADDVPVIAETRAGGEALLVNGRITQADGEWYRVALPDGRPAWFKASLTVPRSRFSETFNSGPTSSSQTFAASAPRILEPAEGVQLGGGPQPVRLAWQGPADASIYIVEIEAYDAVARRWVEEPLHKRVTVESLEELAEAIPRTGAWRWRVRGISPAGEQSQFSRWSAFGIRD